MTDAKTDSELTERIEKLERRTDALKKLFDYVFFIGIGTLMGRSLTGK